MLTLLIKHSNDICIRNNVCKVIDDLINNNTINIIYGSRNFVLVGNKLKLECFTYEKYNFFCGIL